MEHRIGTRSKLAVPVALRQGDKFLGWFRTRDIAPGGIAIQGGVGTLANNSMVNVALESANPNVIPLGNFKAVVVHQKHDCLGLMWVENHPEVVALLAN